MAEREGFEPSVRFYPYNRLAGGCLQPYSATSPDPSGTFPPGGTLLMQPRKKGKECPPPVERSVPAHRGGGSRIRTCGASPPNGFQDRRLQPLGHPSTKHLYIPDCIRREEGKMTRRCSRGPAMVTFPTSGGFSGGPSPRHDGRPPTDVSSAACAWSR